MQMGKGGEDSATCTMGRQPPMSQLPVKKEPASSEAYSRDIGHTEEGWMKAYEGGTGHTVLGVLLRGRLERGTLQEAVDAVLRNNPRANSMLLLPGHWRPSTQHDEKHNADQKGEEHGTTNVHSDHQHPYRRHKKPTFWVPPEPYVRVKVTVGWEPRESMEQLYLQQQQATQGQQQAEKEERQPSASRAEPLATSPFDPLDKTAADTKRPSNNSSSSGSSEGLTGQGRVDTCFEIGRRWEPRDCDGSCGCGGGQRSPWAPAIAEDASVEQGSAGPEAAEQGDTATKQRCCPVGSGKFKLSMCQDKWLQIVEAAMNEPWESAILGEGEDEDESSEGGSEDGEQDSVTYKYTRAESPSRDSRQDLLGAGRPEGRLLQLLGVTLHRLPPHHSLILMKVHTMACDRVSAALLMEDLLRALSKITFPHASEPAAAPASGSDAVDEEEGEEEFFDALEEHGIEEEGGNDEVEEEGVRVRRRNPKSVEDCIPHNMSQKPFWAHGFDVIGYGLGSRRHACLPFRNTQDPRRSQLIRSGLSRADTDVLLQACKRHNTSLYGVLSAAVLAAAAQSKALGRKAEHFGVTTLLDLRPLLPDELHARTMGFYHSAMMSTHQVSEETELWDLARRCHDSIAHATEKRKHFTDMGDLLMLMGQAMQHPNLTPASSMRTSLLSIFRDTLFEKMEGYVTSLGVEDYIGCSSVHGVGPCLAVFDSIREDGLHMANVYPAPLFSRSQMRRVVVCAMELLHTAIQEERILSTKGSQ